VLETYTVYIDLARLQLVAGYCGKLQNDARKIDSSAKNYV